jgi:hypothetical protein
MAKAHTSVDISALLLNRTVVYGVLIFILVLVGGESLARQPEIQANLPYPAIGGGHDALERQLYLLEKYVQEHGDLDCFFVGSSIVRAGIRPDTFEAGYRLQTAETINCFNFGVQGLNPGLAHTVIEMVINRYAPPLLIYGTASFEYYVSPTNTDAQNTLHSDWIRFQNGSFNIAGWFTEHSLLYRYALLIPEFLQNDAGLSPSTDINHALLDRGLTSNPIFTASSPLHLLTRNPRANLVFDTNTQFTPSEADYSGLQSIVQMSAPESRFIVVEMPTFSVPNGPAGNASMTVIARDNGVPFWETDHLGMDDIAWNFIDPVHMHFFAATNFSYWLGQQVGAVVQQGLFDNAINPDLLDEPPLSDLNIERYRADIAPYLDDLYVHYEEQAVVPLGSRVFNPATEPFDRQFTIDALGFYSEILADERDLEALYELGGLLNQMRFENELDLSETEREHLVQWRSAFQPEALHEAGIDYLIYTNVWRSFVDESTARILDNADNYEFLGEWWHPALLETFLLFGVVDR